MAPQCPVEKIQTHLSLLTSLTLPTPRGLLHVSNTRDSVLVIYLFTYLSSVFPASLTSLREGTLSVPECG